MVAVIIYPSGSEKCLAQCYWSNDNGKNLSSPMPLNSDGIEPMDV